MGKLDVKEVLWPMLVALGGLGWIAAKTYFQVQSMNTKLDKIDPGRIYADIRSLEKRVDDLSALFNASKTG